MPRNLAADVLEDILHHKRPFESSFFDRVSSDRLDIRDKAFSYHMIFTTLRRLGQIDNMIDQCLERPLSRKAAGAKTILRLGAAQLLFLNTPPHAAVNTSVQLAQKRKLGAYEKLINAILRRLAREGMKLTEAQDEGKLNTPTWLWDSWTNAYGQEVCYSIAKAHLFQAPLDITVKENAIGWAARLSGTVLPTGNIRLENYGLVDTLSGFEEGAWWVQDVAASLPVKLLGKVKGIKIADLCAAPGGKTAQLAAAGAQVLAIDRSTKRIATLEQNLARLKLTVKTVLADAVNWHPGELLDAVLIDAPCTATGTIRRHPDIQHLKFPQDLKKSSHIQRALLDSAVKMVKSGGIIIYTTCSIQPEEGPEIIDQLVTSGAPVKRRSILANEFPGGRDEFLTPLGDLRTLPSHMAEFGGMDGFFASRLIRS